MGRFPFWISWGKSTESLLTNDCYIHYESHRHPSSGTITYLRNRIDQVSDKFSVESGVCCMYIPVQEGVLVLLQRKDSSGRLANNLRAVLRAIGYTPQAVSGQDLPKPSLSQMKTQLTSLNSCISPHLTRCRTRVCI